MRRIPLTNGGHTVVSNCDFVYLRKKSWTRNPDGYVVRYEGNSRKPKYRRTILMHLVIARRAGRRGLPQIDHHDRVKTNNYRSNLRSARMTEQRGNQTKLRNNTSGFKGVFWQGQICRWFSQIRAWGLLHYLGVFGKTKVSKIKAAYAYDVAALILFKKFACLNAVDHLLDTQTKRQIKRDVLDRLNK